MKMFLKYNMSVYTSFQFPAVYFDHCFDYCIIFLPATLSRFVSRDTNFGYW